MNIIKEFEKKQIEQLTKESNIPDFRAGDTVKVNVIVTEGSNQRVHAYERRCNCT